MPLERELAHCVVHDQGSSGGMTGIADTSLEYQIGGVRLKKPFARQDYSVFAEKKLER